MYGNEGIVINANNENNELPYDLRINLICNKDAKEIENEKLEVKDHDSSRKKTLIIVTLHHKDACGFDALGFLEGLGWFQYVLEAVLMLAGLFVCFFGLKMWKPTLGIMGFFIGFFASNV